MLGHNERLARKLNEHGGRRAWAAVLESKQDWASSGGSNVTAGQAGSFTIHQRFRLRVEPDGEPSFEATVRQVFNDARGWHIPHEGDSVTVIYDPDDHSKLVIDLDAMPVASGFDRDEATARHERVMARMQDPAAWRQRAAEMKAAAAGQVWSAAAAQEMIAKAFPQARDAAPGFDVAGQLSKLADLRDRGVLTDAEFEAQKARLLSAR